MLDGFLRISDALIGSPLHKDAQPFLPLVGVFAYLITVASDLQDGVEFRVGKIKSDSPKYEFAARVSNDPRVAFYPTQFVHELLVPSLLYSIRQIGQGELIVASSPSIK